MKTLALCFLIYDKIECEDLWEEWIRGNEDKVRIYIHSKTEYTPVTSYFNNHAVRIDTIPTQWAHSTLVKATLNLYTKAVSYPENTMFILLSGACIPIKSFMDTYSNLIQNEDFSYAQNLHIVDMIRYSRLVKKLGGRQNCVKIHHQWIILCRNHVEFVLSKYNNILELYRAVPFSDESWFLTILSLHDKESEVIKQQTTFTNWGSFTDRYGHPKTYNEISDEELYDIVNNSDYMFARKFTRETPNLVSRLKAYWEVESNCL